MKLNQEADDDLSNLKFYVIDTSYNANKPKSYNYNLEQNDKED